MSVQSSPVNIQPQQPQIIYVKEKSASGTSKFIDGAMAPFVLKAGGYGMTAGMILGIGKAFMSDNGAWILAGAVGGTILGAGSASILSKGLQVAADAIVNTSVYVIKLPFKATYAAGSLGCQGISAAYNAVMGSKASVEESCNVKPAEALENHTKIA